MRLVASAALRSSALGVLLLIAELANASSNTGKVDPFISGDRLRIEHVQVSMKVGFRLEDS